MKKIFILCSAILCTKFSIGQYIAGSAAETNMGALIPSSCSFNDVGCDTRSAGGSAVNGYGSMYYDDFTHVAVNSCNSTAFNAPTFYWENSLGFSGQSPLPDNVLDPDVVMVSDPGSNDIWAIAVYYSPDMGAYGMSVANLVGAGFGPMSAPVWGHTYTPAVGDPEPHINIDSDNTGHYAIVLQMADEIRSFTGITNALGPAMPGNMRSDANLREPDIACLGNSAYEVNIIAVTSSRNNYVTFTRSFAGARYSDFLSPFLPALHEPRIAAPSSGTMNEYSITVHRTYPSGAGINDDIIVQSNEMAINVANDGSMASLTGINVNNQNTQPALTYGYLGLSTNETVIYGWWAETIGPGPGVPNQSSTFVGIETNVLGTVTSDPSLYYDITNAIGLNNQSTIALSGRYSDWAKNATFTYENSVVPGFAEQLYWKYEYVGSAWKPASVNELDELDFMIFPNPSSDRIQIRLSESISGAQYEIQNQLGQVVLEGSISDQQKEISVAEWNSGIYNIQITDKNGDKKNLRFVKQ